ncbi:MAG: hypothetical protein H0T39_15065 [Actinobacteria bacterium]|nr:hypothetical protein [Actinomycetota bacterium]
MGGRRSDWLRWCAVLGGLVLGLRLAVLLILPILPDAFAWGSSLLLGTAITFLLLPLPHEATLSPRPDRPGPRE